MSPKFRPPVIVWFVLLVSTAASIWVAAQRFRSENSNRAVHFLVDFADVRLLASSAGKTIPTTLQLLKDAGVTGVALAEDSWDDLLTAGRIEPVYGKANRYRVLDANLAMRLNRVLAARVQSGDIGATIETPFGDIDLPVPIATLRTLGLGFDDANAKLIRDAGVALVVRLANPPIADERSLTSVVAEAKRVRAEGCLLAGDQILGRRDLVPFAAEKIREADLWFGAVEFSNQGGLQKLMRLLVDRTVRVHSMVAAEIDKNEYPDIVDRYVRSVVERSMKALFLRPISNASPSPLNAFTEYIGKIRERLREDGYEAKPVRFVEPFERPLWSAVVLSLGMAVVCIWLASRWFAGVPLYVFSVLVAALIAAVASGFGSKYIAFLGALAFPIWAMLAAFSQEGGSRWKWASAYLWIPLLSTIGGLHIAGLLTEATFTLRLDQFAGVKAAHFLPPIAVGAALLLQRVKWKDLLQDKVRWLDAGLLLAVGIALLLMVTRTGNDAPGEVSGIELRMRSLLDALLPERPRTKEFLVGYPALLFGLLLASSGRTRFLPLLALLATIGQASVVNTFCHLHTPIEVSLMRVVVGMAAGLMVGGFLYVLLFVFRRLAPSQKS